MKLPFVDALETVVLGRMAAPIPPPFLELKHGEEPAEFSPGRDWLEYRTRCVLGYHQTAPHEARDQVRHDTIRALTHHLYGDIHRELIEAVLELRRAGMRPDAKPMQRLEAIIAATSP